MTPPLPALRDFSDHLSPMVVKEMRQGLRTRFFTAALILFHLVLGCLMLSYLFDMNQRDTKEVFWLVIIVTLLGVLPSRAFNALNAEVKDGTLDMLMLTGITSFRIVWGKWVSLYSQTLLVASSLLPYMIVRYQFGGVEIARETLGLAVLVLGSGVVTAALVGFSSQKLLLVRLLMAATVGAGAFSISVFAYLLAAEDFISQEISQNLISAGATQASLTCLGIAALAVYLGYQFLCLGSARLPCVTDSHAAIKRVTAMLVLPGMAVLAWGLAWQGYGESVIVASAYMPAMLFLLILGMDLVTEEPPGDSSTASRWFLKAGWPSGVPLSCLLWLAPFLILLAYEWRTADGWEIEPWFMTLSFMAATFVPLCIPIFRRHSRLSQWWAVQLLMLAAGIVLTIALETMSYGDREGHGFLGLLFPVSSMFASESASSADRDAIRFLGFFTHSIWIIAALVSATRERRRARGLDTAIHRPSADSPIAA
jgi:hypothetical protein